MYSRLTLIKCRLIILSLTLYAFKHQRNDFVFLRLKPFSENLLKFLLSTDLDLIKNCLIIFSKHY
jgi:hypothetical protein